MDNVWLNKKYVTILNLALSSSLLLTKMFKALHLSFKHINIPTCIYLIRLMAYYLMTSDNPLNAQTMSHTVHTVKAHRIT